jgi:hypothetical protein
MNDNVPKSASTLNVAPPVPKPVDPRAIAMALAGIRSDSQRQPETYLRDTVVPHGGE